MKIYKYEIRPDHKAEYAVIWAGSDEGWKLPGMEAVGFKVGKRDWLKSKLFSVKVSPSSGL